MPKDKTKAPQKNAARLSISYRRLSRKPPEGSGNGNNVSTIGGTSTIIDMEDSSVTNFLKQADIIRVDIDKLDELVQQVKQLHRSGKLIEPQPNPKLLEELDEKRAQVKKLSDNVSAKLKNLVDAQETQDDSQQSKALWRIQESQISVITRRFRDIMIQHNQDYLEHRERCKKAIMRQLEITGTRRSDDELEDMIEQGNADVFTLGIMVETQQAKQSLNLIEARCEDILKLEKGMRELHSMFADLAALVATQGGMIDSIEDNVRKAVEYVEVAADEVDSAVKYEKKARKKAIFIALIVICIVTVLILILAGYFTQGKKLFG